MKGIVIRTAEQEEYPHPKHDRFFLRDVVTAENNPALSLHRGRIEAGGEILPHTHEGQTETFYILGGEAVCTVNGVEHHFGPGCCVVARQACNTASRIPETSRSICWPFSPRRLNRHAHTHSSHRLPTSAQVLVGRIVWDTAPSSASPLNLPCVASAWSLKVPVYIRLPLKTGLAMRGKICHFSFFTHQPVLKWRLFFKFSPYRR